MTLPKLAIVGALGKMGRAIARLAIDKQLFQLTATIDSPDSPHQNVSYCEITHIGHKELKITSSLESSMDKPDVVIDFSSPASTLHHVQIASRLQIPYVIGTTGMEDEILSQVKDTCSRIPLIISPNMALGVNVTFLAAEFLARAIGEIYDIEIIEGHHNQKKDAPSGTALKLFDVMANVLHKTRDDIVHGREGITGARTKKEIGMHAVRAGDIIGEHKVLFAGNGEQIELTHRALTRDTFALGSLKCAQYLIGKPTGLYSMLDVLGLK